MTIYIGNFPPETSEEQIRSIFETYGKVRKVNVISDPFSGRGLGFGFVDMYSKKHTQEAIEGLCHTRIGGRVVMVTQTCSRQERRTEAREV